MRFLILLAILTLIAAPTPSAALELYGRVWTAPNNTPAAGARVTLNCGTNFRRSGVTDKRGIYRLRGPRSPTRCTVTVSNNRGASNAIKIFVSGNRTTGNFELRRRGKGWAIVRR